MFEKLAVILNFNLRRIEVTVKSNVSKSINGEEYT